MSTNKEDQLFALIHSLTKNEKRYFKIQASAHVIGKVNNYVLLFDAIAQQTFYDEMALKKTLKKDIPNKHFRVVKNYLYEMILKNLHFYHSEATIENRLKKMVHTVDILFKKNLYNQCNTILDKAEKAALRLDKFEILMEIYKWRKNIISLKSFEDVPKKEIEQLYEKECAVLDKIKKTITYDLLSYTFFYQYLKTSSRNKAKDIQQYATLINNPLLKDENAADSIQAQFRLYNILGTYYRIIGQLKTAQLYYIKHLACFEKYPELVNEYPSNFLATSSNLIISYILSKKYNDALFLLDKMKKVKPQTPQTEIRKFILIYSQKLNVLTTMGESTKALALIPDIEDGIRRYGDKIPASDLFRFYFYMACLYVIIGEYKKALIPLQEIINHAVSFTVIDIQSFSRILNLMAHYELKNTNYLPHLIRSTYRFLIKKERLFEFENVLLRFIKKLADKPDETGLIKLFHEFKIKCLILAEDPSAKTAFEYFDFISWLDSKIENRPMIEIMKKKLK